MQWLPFHSIAFKAIVFCGTSGGLPLWNKATFDSQIRERNGRGGRFQKSLVESLFPFPALLSPFCLERSSQHFIICLSGAKLAIDLHPSKPLILLVPITCTTYLQKRAQPGFSQRCAQDYESQCEQLFKVPWINFLMSNLIRTKHIRSHLKCRQNEKLETSNIRF